MGRTLQQKLILLIIEANIIGIHYNIWAENLKNEIAKILLEIFTKGFSGAFSVI